MLQGLPDLSGIPYAGAVSVLPPFEGGAWTALVTGLHLARRADGTPDLTLAKFRPARPGETPAPGGTLDFRLELSYDMANALAAARQVNSGATVSPASITTGFLHLSSTTPSSALPASLSGPVPVVWDELDSGRFTLNLPPDGASTFGSMLQDGTVTLSAHAELEFPGVAPRVAVQIVFDPAALIAEIGDHIGQQGLIPRSALIRFLQEPPASITNIAGSWNDGAATALADWIRARLLMPSSAPLPGTETYLKFGNSTASTGSFRWDLSEPIVTWRAIVAEFDPLADARAFVAAHGVDALITETDIPSLPTGLNMVTVTANLPAVRPGMLEMGVILDAPPNPPWRMQERTATVVLAPSAEIAYPILHLAPDEPLRFNAISYAALAGADELRGPGLQCEGETLRLHLNDFPVDFFIVKASAALLDLCTIRLTFQPAGATQADVAELVNGERSVAFSQPPGLTGAHITAELRPNDGTAPIVLGPVPAAPWALDLASCPSYGPQHTLISVSFAASVTEYAVELLAETAQESPDTITVYRFTPDLSQRAYAYDSPSPFHGGYRWREYRASPPLAEWALAATSAPLALVAAAATESSSGATV